MNPYSVDPYPSDIMMLLAKRYKELRKLKKWSQAEAAKRSNVSLGSLKRFEATGQMALESLLKLALIIGRLDDFKNVFDIKEDLSRIEELMK